mgnify:FL=1
MIKVKKTCRSKLFFILIALVFIIALAAASAFYFVPKLNKKPAQANVSENIYISFVDEIYDKIKANYWEKISDDELANLFKLGAEKLSGKPQTLTLNDKIGLNKMLEQIISSMSEEQKQQFIPQLADLVLKNLKPFGLSGLYTQKLEQELANKVKNINPEINLYADLGLAAGATEQEVKIAYEEKKAELEKQKTPEAEAELKKIAYAHEVLAEPERKQKYDSFGIEPTILYRLIKPNILHLRITRFSPTTLDEFQKATEAVDKGEILDTLILDLRNNIGGAIDAMPYFLGPFIGKDQYAYEYYRQGEREPYKTVVGWLPSLVRYKKVIILIDDKAQSSAELMAASLKKYNVGVTVGVPTKGWGTIERVFELENQISPAEIYSMFLVHTITLRDDGEPIEGRGVEPLINVQDPSWTKELYKYFNSNEIVSVVKQLWDEGVE